MPSNLQRRRCRLVKILRLILLSEIILLLVPRLIFHQPIVPLMRARLLIAPLKIILLIRVPIFAIPNL